MDFNEYQVATAKTAAYPQFEGIEAPLYPALGLSGEAGEVSEIVKKSLRDSGGKLSVEDRTRLKKELGDVLWYLARLAADLGIALEDVASHNLDKLLDRKARGVIHGSGDNR